MPAPPGRRPRRCRGAARPTGGTPLAAGRAGPGVPATGDRLLFFTDGLLEARDRAGRFFRLDQQIQALSRPDLQAAADELLDRLRAHTRRRIDDDVAILLAELTLTGPGLRLAALGQRPAAGATVRAA